MKKIYLIRHGQSENNAGGAAKPNRQVALTETGQQQAAEVAQWVIDTLGEDIAAVYVSKFIRTQQTAQPLLDKMGVKPTLIDGLEEFDYLSFSAIDGQPFAKRLQMTDDYWASAHPDDKHGEDAESFNQFYQRVAKVRAYFNTLPAGNHVVFAHGFWISMLIWQILGQPHQDAEHVRKFRQFELSVRAKNCEVFCLTLLDANDQCLPSITKVRVCHDQNTDLSAK